MLKSPVVMWNRNVAQIPYNKNSVLTSLTCDLEGSIYVGGYTDSSIDGIINNGQNDAFLIKYNPNGTKAWTKLVGSSVSDVSHALATGLDGSIYFGGNTSGSIDGQSNFGSNDAFIIKYNPDGTKAWTKLMGSASADACTDLSVGIDGSIYIGGNTSGSIDGQSNTGSTDAFLTKLNPNGTKAWTKLVGSTSSDSCDGLITSSDGSIYLLGSAGSSVDGQAYAGGGGPDAFLTKFNPDGTKAWTKMLGSSESDKPYSITAGLDGSIYVCGGTNGALDGQANSGGFDAFLTKFNSDGTKAWTKLLGNGENNFAISLTTGRDGSIYLSGYTVGELDGQANSGGSDAFISKFNTDGTKDWTKLLGSYANDFASVLRTDPSGSLYLGYDVEYTMWTGTRQYQSHLFKLREVNANSVSVKSILDASDLSSTYGLYKMTSGSYAVAEFGLDLDAVPESPMLMLKDSKGNAWTTSATSIAIKTQNNTKTNAEEFAMFTVTGTGAKVSFAEEIFAISSDGSKLTSTTGGKATTLSLAQAVTKEISYGQDLNGDGSLGPQIKLTLAGISDFGSSDLWFV